MKKKTHAFVAVLPSMLFACFSPQDNKVIVYSNPPRTPTSTPDTIQNVAPTSQAQPQSQESQAARQDCPSEAEISTLAGSSCATASKQVCTYGNCGGTPTTTATCHAQSKTWVVQVSTCNPPSLPKPPTPSK